MMLIQLQHDKIFRTHFRLMKKYINYFLFLIMMFSSLSCTNSTIHNGKSFSIDQVLVFSLDYLLKEKKLAKEYYELPLQIIKSKKYPIASEIVVNDLPCVLLPENTNVDVLLQDMDIFKPIPLVEIIHFDNEDEQVKLGLIFRSSGHAFYLTLKKSIASGYEVIKLEDRTI